MESAPNLVAARSFARSLNILLKTVRLYGVDHERTTSSLGTAWEELRAAQKDGGQAGLLLGVSGGQIVLDGVPMEKRPSDRSFAQLLTAAGLASIHFSNRVTVDDLWLLVRAFSSRTGNTGPMAAELTAALGGEKGAIRVNEVRFVAQDASLGEAGVAALLAARSMGPDAQRLQALLQDPQRLLQLIVAAEGARNRPGGPGGLVGLTGSIGGIAGGPVTAPAAAGATNQPVQEDDIFKVLRWLTHLGESAEHPESGGRIADVEKELNQLPPTSQAALAQALSSMSLQSDPPRADDPVLLQLAERVAIRFALERYDRGDVRTNAVLELLDRLKREIGSLRTILKGHEEKMGKAGVEVESHAEILDRQFWARVPDKAKRKMLLSPEAWAVPPRNIRQFVEELLNQGDVPSARAILDNYANCLRTGDVDARRKASTGLTEMVDLFSRTNHSLLKSSLHHMGETLCREANADLQTTLGASFVRFSHEAAAHRQYPAVNEALEAMERLEQKQPGLARILWPRVKVGNPLPEFINEALHAPVLPGGLVDVLRRMPHATVEEVSSRVQKCGRRDEWARLLEMVAATGPGVLIHLRRILETRPAGEAANKIALLSRLGPLDLEELLPARLRDWDTPAHDQVVRQLACSLAPQRTKILNKVYDLLDPAVLAEVVDELGMSDDSGATPRLMSIVERGLSDQGSSYLEIKAIEALGRLRERRAESLLRPLAESKKFWRWTHPREVRICAVQALKKIDPEWTQKFLPKSGLSWADLKVSALDPDPETPWLRQRRYARMKLPAPLSGMISPERSNYRVSIQELSLGGGVASSPCLFKPGTAVPLTFRSGMENIRARILVRESRPQEMAFEISDIEPADLTRLRRPVVRLASKEN